MSAVAFILLYGVSYGLVLCLVAIGLVVTMGLMGVINLAHGAFAAIGGYLAVCLMNSHGFPVILAIAVAVLLVMLLSVAIERLLIRHLYATSHLDQLLMTIGIDFIVVGCLTLAFGGNVYPVKVPPWLAGSVDLGFRSFEVYRIAVMIVCLIVILCLWIAFDRTTLGAKLRAAVDNRTMTEATGINVSRMFTLTFALGAGLASLGGAIGAPMIPLEPNYPFKYLVLVLIIVSLSGAGNVRAAVTVSVLVGIVDTAGRYLLPTFGGFTVYLLLVALMIWRRNGLFAGAAR
jgi:branched-chain amino acid transport system permease protein